MSDVESTYTFHKFLKFLLNDWLDDVPVYICNFDTEDGSLKNAASNILIESNSTLMVEQI